jgi:hypothetical protein
MNLRTMVNTLIQMGKYQFVSYEQITLLEVILEVQ